MPSRKRDSHRSQLALPIRGGRAKGTHGGKRRGAGRPNLSGKQGHGRRPALDTRHPVHLTLRLAKGVPGFRSREVFPIWQACLSRAKAKGLRIIHFAILSNHVHLILEPRSRSLGRAIQGLTISFSKRLNAHFKRKGAVFHDRYDIHVLKTPTEVRNALAYVLTNEHVHAERTRAQASNGVKSQSAQSPTREPGKTPPHVRIDLFSTAWVFQDWTKLFKRRPRFEFGGWPEHKLEGWLESATARPTTWLLRSGWMRARAVSKAPCLLPTAAGFGGEGTES